MCIFMFLPFGKATGLLFVFKVRLLPDLSHCSFFPLRSASTWVTLKPALFLHLYLPLCLSVSLLLVPFLSMQIELASSDAGRMLISSNLHPNNGRSREPIHLFFSPLIHPPWTLDSSLSSSLSVSAFHPVAPIPLLYCAFRMLGAFGNE